MCRFFASHSAHGLSVARLVLPLLLCALPGVQSAWAAHSASSSIRTATQVDAAQADESAAGSDTTDQNTAGQLQEVVVTARRREENLANEMDLLRHVVNEVRPNFERAERRKKE